MSAKSTRRRRQPRVTVIDDNAEMLSIMNEVLESAGYHVTTMSIEHATVARVAGTAPDLIILDLVLGQEHDQLNGWDYLRLVRSHPSLRAVPVLVCSADIVRLRASKDELRDVPAISVLEKPFTLEDLERSVVRLLGASSPPTWDEERDVVLVADAQARLISASAAALKVLGTELKQLRSLTVADVVAHSTEWTAREWERYRANGRWEGAVTLRTLDGRVVPAVSVAEIVSSRGTDWHVSRLTLHEPVADEAKTAG